MSERLLEKINTPSDVKSLTTKQIPTLCDEIREFLIDVADKRGGHLASNLGAVELSVAIHRVFDSPSDHIIFDVGHQSYVHKILTGRRLDFDTLGIPGGLSGFTKMSESVHDAFGAGHSSTSVSAALGYAEADRIKGSSSYTVAVVGDGAYTGGMIHEALNNADPDLKLIIIINENGMSISANKGSFARYLTRVHTSKRYIHWKRGTKSILAHLPIIGKPLQKTLGFIKSKIKNMFFSSNYFEDLGLYYIGPIDGNDYKSVEKALYHAKRLEKCVVVHLKTQKGKGYQPAEQEPEWYHSVTSEKNDSFHTELVTELINVANSDKTVIAVTPAMGSGSGFDKFGERFPDRYFDVGIAEGHAVTFSAGLAADGMKPFVSVYSTFLQRAYDSVLHDVALQKIPINIMVDRAGLALRDGATHHGIFDVAFLSHVPNITLISPASYSALRCAVGYALTHDEGPVAIRYPNKSESKLVSETFYKDCSEELSLKADFSSHSEVDCVFITYGTIAENVLLAKEKLVSQGKSVGVILLEILKPYNVIVSKAMPYLAKARKILFVEEGIRNGGAGMIFRDELISQGFSFEGCSYDIAAIEDNFASPDSPCDLYGYVGLSPEKIIEKMNRI